MSSLFDRINNWANDSEIKIPNEVNKYDNILKIIAEINRYLDEILEEINNENFCSISYNGSNYTLLTLQNYMKQLQQNSNFKTEQEMLKNSQKIIDLQALIKKSTLLIKAQIIIKAVQSPDSIKLKTLQSKLGILEDLIKEGQLLPVLKDNGIRFLNYNSQIINQIENLSNLIEARQSQLTMYQYRMNNKKR